MSEIQRWMNPGWDGMIAVGRGIGLPRNVTAALTLDILVPREEPLVL